MKIFKSKIGIEVVIFIAILISTTSIIMINNRIWIGLSLNIALIGFIYYLFSSTYYIINDNDLTIKCGFLSKQTIKISQIKKITETYNPLGSPAASLDRIAIEFNKFESVMISPKNKIDFIQQLLIQNDKIVVVFRKSSTINIHSISNKTDL